MNYHDRDDGWLRRLAWGDVWYNCSYRDEFRGYLATYLHGRDMDADIEDED
jgi:hypothetical protein